MKWFISFGKKPLEAPFDPELRLIRLDLADIRIRRQVEEDLPLMLRRHSQTGEEIRRIADTRLILVRIEASEREVGSISVSWRVRLKTRVRAGSEIESRP
jgi:hypothetical protein